MTDLLTGIGDAPVFEKGKFHEPGKYRSVIRKTLIGPTQKSGVCLIVELEVVRCSNPAHPPGDRTTWIQKMTDRNVALPAMKEFFMAALGLVPSDKDDQEKIRPHLETLARKCQTEPTATDFCGREIDYEVVVVMTKKGTPFNRHKWMPGPSEANPKGWAFAD